MFLDETNTMYSYLFSPSPKQEVTCEKNYFHKQTTFLVCLMTPGTSATDLSSNRFVNPAGTRHGLHTAFSTLLWEEVFLDIADFLQKKIISGEC